MRILLLPALVAGLVLTGCASGPGPGGITDWGPVGPDYELIIGAPGEVQGQGTVMQLGDATPQLCLGAILESYPPQCSGPEIDGWDWEAVDGEERSGDATWGAYVVTGLWDGIRFTVTSAMMLALYDPMPIADPLLDPENAGDTDPAELERVREDIEVWAPFTLLETRIENGYVFVRVIYDDGSLQDRVDRIYLPDVVAIRPALHDIG